MLRLKRASAGSGKTYELAKTYIKLLITSKFPGKNRSLKKDDSYRESLSSILAVTFTVKATAEMKERIVEKLADLSRADDPNLTDKEKRKIDYLNDFKKELQTNEVEIAEHARKALRTLLLHYSDFKVQTIDSFFQSILHTFAYEASLDDSFNMEINTELVTSIGFDHALDEFSRNMGKLSGSSDGKEDDSLRWLRVQINENTGSNHWNVFVRDATSKNSLYAKLIRNAQRLEKEDYQQIRLELKEYFNKGPESIKDLIDKIDKAYYECFRQLHEERKNAAKAYCEVLGKYGLTEEHSFRKQSKKLLAHCSEFVSVNQEVPKVVSKGTGESNFSLSADGKNLIRDMNPAVDAMAATAEIDKAFLEWCDAAQRYFDEYFGKSYKTWLLYRSMFPELMLALEIARRKEEYLAATNTLQISDTSHILSQIIGEDDTPFVYERLGSRLNHYLIDEFQDTSRLQWRNLRPLLHESNSSGHDNLIIGDAKQSIYRFRNADYTLISQVNQEFPDVEDDKDKTSPEKPENVNYRSKEAIVKFNNFIFSNIINLPSVKKKGELLFPDSVRAVYRDCTQNIPSPSEDEGPRPEGYVEITYYNGAKDSNDEEGGTASLEDMQGFRDLPQKILELKRRGYRSKDIGILVKKHKEGQAVFKVISKHNSEHPNESIRLISEENLLVGSALSVQIVVQALKIAAAGQRIKTKKNTVLADPVDETELLRVLRGLPSLALPVIVDAVVREFVPERRRTEEAAFIAAFQDAVIDYCAGHTGDIGSFLKWWEHKSQNLSIISPEDSDGVKLQTIHKSKGLEHKCVIIPMANFSFTPQHNQKEWKWVKTDTSSIPEGDKLPPYMPVVLQKNYLEGTAHEKEYLANLDAVALDELNKMYVGFTRAVNELYLYLPEGKSDSHNSSNAIRRLLEDREDIERKPGTGADRLPVIKFGRPLVDKEVSAEINKELRKKARKQRGSLNLSRYDSYGMRGTVGDGGAPVAVLGETSPRTEGLLKHKIMQMVEKVSDLDKALLRMRVKGKITPQQEREWGSELRDAIAKEADRGWFDEEAEVITERSIIFRGMSSRPDRIVVGKNGEAVIIDYKFGSPDAKYKRQIRGYASALMKTGRFRKVSAFLWYIPLGQVEEVET